MVALLSLKLGVQETYWRLGGVTAQLQTDLRAHARTQLRGARGIIVPGRINDEKTRQQALQIQLQMTLDGLRRS